MSNRATAFDEGFKRTERNNPHGGNTEHSPRSGWVFVAGPLLRFQN